MNIIITSATWVVCKRSEATRWYLEGHSRGPDLQKPWEGTTDSGKNDSWIVGAEQWGRMTGCVVKESATELAKFRIKLKVNKPQTVIDFWIGCELAYRKYIMKLRCAASEWRWEILGAIRLLRPFETGYEVNVSKGSMPAGQESVVSTIAEHSFDAMRNPRALIPNTSGTPQRHNQIKSKYKP